MFSGKLHLLIFIYNCILYGAILSIMTFSMTSLSITHKYMQLCMREALHFFNCEGKRGLGNGKKPCKDMLKWEVRLWISQYLPSTRPDLVLMQTTNLTQVLASKLLVHFFKPLAIFPCPIQLTGPLSLYIILTVPPSLYIRVLLLSYSLVINLT